MTLGELVLAELEKHGKDFAPAHQHIVMLTKELITKYQDQLEALSGISTMYVRTFHELDDLKKVQR